MGRYRVRPAIWAVSGLLAASAALLAFGLPAALQAREFTVRSADYRIQAEIITDRLDQPWALAFLPDGQTMLVTEKHGALRTVTRTGELSDPIAGLPRIEQIGQGGLLDVVLDPAFDDNRLIYLSYAKEVRGGWMTAILRARLSEDLSQLSDAQDIFVASGANRGGRHFGSRMVFDDEGYLYLTIGDRGERDTVQDGDTHRGTLLRLTRDGAPAPGNPFPAEDGHQLPEVYSWGHRNPQGLVRDPASGRIWLHEHGPQGGDEINLIEAGGNYGWAAVSYGENYGGGRFAPRSAPGFVEPIHTYVPSIAPSGMAFYDGEAFAAWRGSLFLGALALRHLNRVELEGTRVVREERLLEDFGQRIRDVRMGPRGFVWLLTDAGHLVVLRPAR